MDYGDPSCMEHLRTGLPTVQISEVDGHECVVQSTDYTDVAADRKEWRRFTVEFMQHYSLSVDVQAPWDSLVPETEMLEIRDSQE